MTERNRILLFEKGDLIGPALRSIMLNHGTEVQLCQDLGTSLEVAATASCILVDSALGATDTLKLVRGLREGGCGTPIIVAVASGDDATTTEFLDAGATDVVSIPLIYAYLMNRLGDFDAGAVTVEPHTLVLRDGTEVAFRFLHPEDAAIEQAFVRDLSDESRYLRFFTYFKELPRGLLKVLTNNVFPRSYAVIATLSTGDEETQIGVARYAPTNEDDTAEFAVVVADEWQGFGLATKLLHIIIVAAAIAGYRQLDGLVLEDNVAMLGLSDKLGFRTVTGYADGRGVHRVRKTLAG